jgi:4-amino-4-deoxy-L-arabinose transferase-like glycosyltransferase
MAMLGYRAAKLGDRPLPDRLLLSRLVSVLLAVVTVVCAFLLVREAFAGSPWPARAAALAAGLQPVLIFNHSVINSDALVIASTTAIAAVLARIWRRGPSLGRALAFGALLALGILAKINFLIVVPCAVAVQLLLWLRWTSVPLRRRALLLAVSWTAAVVPALGYAVASDAIWEPSVQDEARVAPPVDADKLRMASHVWQTFLPPLPFMNDLFPGGRPPAVDAMLFGTTTRLGWWNDYGIAGPWSTLIVLAAAALVAFGAVTAARHRGRRLALFVAAAVTVVYTVLLVASLYLPNIFQVQGRYLLPLTFVWALAAGSAVSALRPRLQGHAVAVLGIAMLGWSALAAHATLLRWYL